MTMAAHADAVDPIARTGHDHMHGRFARNAPERQSAFKKQGIPASAIDIYGLAALEKRRGIGIAAASPRRLVRIADKLRRSDGMPNAFSRAGHPKAGVEPSRPPTFQRCYMADVYSHILRLARATPLMFADNRFVIFTLSCAGFLLDSR